MATLYELTAEYAELLDAVEVAPGEQTVPATGEVVTEDEFLRRLYALEGDIDTKVENCVKVVRTLEADATTLRDEERQLAERRRRMEKRVEDLRTYCSQEMVKAKRPKIKTARFTIYLGPEGQEVVIEDATAIPDTFVKEPPPPPTREQLLDRTALRNAMREARVPGAHLQATGRFPLVVRVGK